jgi:SH3 domain-containing YSC84-like protein 1
MALLLMSAKAVEAFENHASQWSLDGSVGLTVVDYSAGKAGTAGDVIVWSDTEGLFGGAAVGVRDISRDEDADRAYYGDPHISSEQILTGDVQNPHVSNARLLQDVLPLRVASK